MTSPLDDAKLVEQLNWLALEIGMSPFEIQAGNEQHQMLFDVRDRLSSVLRENERLREEKLEAVRTLDACFKPIPHLNGCLFRNDRRMPCQCGHLDRVRALEAKALNIIRENRAALEGLPPRA